MQLLVSQMLDNVSHCCRTQCRLCWGSRRQNSTAVLDYTPICGNSHNAKNFEYMAYFNSYNLNHQTNKHCRNSIQYQ
eukprot:3260753-Amphidinium_carterae.3